MVIYGMVIAKGFGAVGFYQRAGDRYLVPSCLSNCQYYCSVAGIVTDVAFASGSPHSPPCWEWGW